MAKLTDLTTLAKTSVASTDFLLVTNSATGTDKKLSVETMFPSISTAGTSSETLYNSATLTNKNQLVFKGIKSGDTGLLTVATTSSNIVLTALEAGIDLSLCNNTTSLFNSGVDFTGTITGECGVANGGTGLATIAKGAMLYASANDVISATAAPTNGQILIGNSTLGYPVLNTITGGTNTDVVNTAGVITINSTLSTMAADLDMANYDIKLGTGWISYTGTHEGINIDSDGKVFIGEDTPSAFFDAALNIKGSITFDEATPPTIKPKARSSSSGVKMTIEGGSASGAVGGDLDLKAGSSTSGDFVGGNLNLYGGDENGTAAAGSIKNFVSNGSGVEVQSLTVTGGVAAPNVTVNTGNLIITEALKGIVHTGTATATQVTNATTTVNSDSTSGIITLFGAALASQAEVEFTFTNDTIKSTSVILTGLECVSTGRTAGANIQVYFHSKTSESCKIVVVNTDDVATDVNDIFKINYLIINPS